MANEVATKQTFSNFLTAPIVKNKINEIIGGSGGQRFITQILSAVTNNPALQECEQMTILNCAFLGESLKLSPSPQLGQYYMVPFKDKKKGSTVATFQLGYKGYIQLAIRSGQYKKLNVLAIKQGELINFNPLEEIIDVDLIQDEVLRENTETIGYYAMFEYVNGFKKAMYWSIAKMMKHANDYSKAFSIENYQKLKNGEIPKEDLWKFSSFWYKDFDGMAYKTMLRQLISKWGIMSIDMQTAFENDMAITDEKDNKKYPDNDNMFIVEQPKQISPEVDKKKIDNLYNKQTKQEPTPLDRLTERLKKDNVNLETFLLKNGLKKDDEMIDTILNDSELYASCIGNSRTNGNAKEMLTNVLNKTYGMKYEELLKFHKLKDDSSTAMKLLEDADYFKKVVNEFINEDGRYN